MPDRIQTIPAPPTHDRRTQIALLVAAIELDAWPTVDRLLSALRGTQPEPELPLSSGLATDRLPPGALAALDRSLAPIDYAAVCGRMGETVTVWGVPDDRGRVVLEIDDGGESVDAHLTVAQALAVAEGLVRAGRG